MRTHHVQKCRKSPGDCGHCGDTIRVGQPYIYWKFRFGGTRVRCVKPVCAPKRWDLTQNDILATLWQAVDGFEGQGTVEETAQALRDLAQQVRDDVVPLYEEKMSNIESGFGHTSIPAYEELEGRKDEMEGWCDELESEADDIENELKAEEDEEDPEAAEDGRVQEAVERARAAVDNCPE